MGSNTVQLGDVVLLEDSKREPLSSRQRASRKGSYPYYGAQGVVDYLNDFTYKGTYLLVAEDGENLRSRKQPIAHVVNGEFRVNNHAHVLRGTGRCDIRVLAWLLNEMNISAYVTGAAQPKLSQRNLLSIELELPTSDSQRQILSLFSPISEKIRLNQRTNDYLAAMGEMLAAAVDVDGEGILVDISMQVVEKAACSESSLESYVSTESLLPSKGGRQDASSLPATGKVTVYKTGDTLVSNIRPYFKKIWFADRDGTCSGDVIVFRAKNPSLAAYLYFALRSDSFFEHVMAGAKGTKMPRGDKKQMMQYPVASEANQGTLDALAVMIGQIGTNNRENEVLSGLRNTLLPKLITGEIDASTVEMPT